MKKSLLALAVLGALAPLAHADTATSPIQVYVILDEGVAHIDHSLPANQQFAFSLNPYNVTAQSQHSVNTVVSGGASMSRFGIQGKYDLDDGFKVFYKLESALNLNNGQFANNGKTVLENANSLTTISGASSINGQPFARAAYAGISHDSWGAVEIGRTPAFSYDQTVDYDPLRASGLYSAVGFSGAIGGGLGITENARLDNSIQYENTIGDVDFGAQYKFGQTNSTDAADIASVFEAKAAYKNGPFSIEATGSETRNSASLSFKLFTNDVGLRICDTNGAMITAKYDLSPASTLDLGWERTNQDNPSSSNNWGTQITTYYGMSLAGLVTAKAFGNTWGDAVVRTSWFGGNYMLTPKFNLIAAYYNVDNYGNNHNDQYTIQAFSLMGDYIFNKKVDVYVAAMPTRYSGEYLTQYSPPELAKSNAIFGTGLRLRF